MNCSNCGGPMEFVARHHYFRCPYCCTFSFPHAEHVDGVAVIADMDEPLHCPVCNGLLAVGTIGPHTVLSCSKCRGWLTSNDRFASIVRDKRANYLGPVNDEPKPIDAADLKRALLCPRCHKAMETHPYYGPGNVVVDTCPRCTLIWLDHGELAMIERHPGGR